MKISEITIDNCKSYRLEERIRFDPTFNILVGPNGGGKSNTLDILTITLRRFLLKEYVVNDQEDAFSIYHDISVANVFSDIPRQLEKNIERPNDLVRLKVVLTAGKSDVENIENLRVNKDRYVEASEYFRTRPFAIGEVIDQLVGAGIAEGATYTFEVHGEALVHNMEPGHLRFLQYLDTINAFILFASHGGIAGLKPCFAHFSPYRAAASHDLRARLSNDSFRAQLAQYANTSSRSPISLLRLAVLFFAEKRRMMEIRARDSGFKSTWEKDPVVASVSKYLRVIGYDWDLVVSDSSKNYYEVRLKQGGREFSIEQASSGEKEILTFILGIFALQTSGGLIVIDEPEVHLHPRWQAVLRDLLQSLGAETGNQLVISTHSPVFITPSTISSVKRVYKSAERTTRVIGGFKPDEADEVDHWHILNSHNNERIFFADKVVLVEGAMDRVLFAALISDRLKVSAKRDVIEVVEVHGKANFEKYSRILTQIGLKTLLIADLDFVEGVADKEVVRLLVSDFAGVTKRVLKDKKSKDRVALAEELDAAIQSGDTTKLMEIWTYIRGRHLRLKNPLDAAEAQQLTEFFTARESAGCFILREGEIEDYLPLDCRSLAGLIGLTKADRFSQWLAKDAIAAPASELVRIADALVH